MGDIDGDTKHDGDDWGGNTEGLINCPKISRRKELTIEEGQLSDDGGLEVRCAMVSKVLRSAREEGERRLTCLRRRARGWPIPPAAPRRATLSPGMAVDMLL